MPYTSGAIKFLLNGLIPSSIKEVEIYLPEVVSAIETLTDESVTKAWEEMPNNAIASIDGSWNHRRNDICY